jgi:broad specificity phosphatase PhoE
LSPKGQLQAEALSPNVDPTVDLNLVSRFERTYLTAKPFLDNNPEIPTASSLHTHEFDYIAAAKFAGKTKEERGRVTDDYWNKVDPYHKDENRESFADFVNRLHLHLMQLKELGNKRVNIFTHGYVIKGLYILTREFPELFLETTSPEIQKEVMQKFMDRMREVREADEIPVENISQHVLDEEIENYISQFRM